MKKSIIALFVTVCLCLCGCAGGVDTAAEPQETDKLSTMEIQRDAEQLAKDINALTFGPGIEDELDRLQEAYEALPTEMRKYVDNFDALVDLRERYDAAMEKVQDAIDAIDDIGEIDENSLDAINYAQSLLDSVDSLFAGEVTNADELDGALEACYQAISDKGVADTRALIEAGQYQNAMNYASDYLSEHMYEINSQTDLTAVMQEAELYWAWDLYQKNYCGYVQDILDDLEYDCVTDELEANRQALQDRMDNYLYSIMPANGTILASSISGGYGEMTIYSGDAPLLVKIEGYGDASRYIYVFLRPNSSTTFNVPDGNYIVKYGSGDKYFGDTAEKPFGSSTWFRQADDIMEFQTTYSGNYVYYSTITLTLYAVADGNLGTHSIDGL